MLSKKTDILIIGSGLAGASAAIAAAESGKNIILITKTKTFVSIASVQEGFWINSLIRFWKSTGIYVTQML